MLNFGNEQDEAFYFGNEVGEVDFSEVIVTNSKLDVSPIVSIATGRNHVLALDTAGRVYSWGDNHKGQLGLTKGSKEVRKPQLVTELDKKQICQIYAGEYHSFAIQKDGEIYAWGNNSKQQLLIPASKSEDGDRSIVSVPVKVPIDALF